MKLMMIVIAESLKKLECSLKNIKSAYNKNCYYDSVSDRLELYLDIVCSDITDSTELDLEGINYHIEEIGSSTPLEWAENTDCDLYYIHYCGNILHEEFFRYLELMYDPDLLLYQINSGDNLDLLDRYLMDKDQTFQLNFLRIKNLKKLPEFTYDNGLEYLSDNPYRQILSRKLFIEKLLDENSYCCLTSARLVNNEGSIDC